MHDGTEMTAATGRRSHVLVCLQKMRGDGEDDGRYHLRVCATDAPRTTLADVRSAYGSEEAVEDFEVFYDVGSMRDRLLGDMAWKRFDDAFLAPAFAGIWHLRDVESDAETFFRTRFLPFVRSKFATYLEDAGERRGGEEKEEETSSSSSSRLPPLEALLSSVFPSCSVSDRRKRDCQVVAVKGKEDKVVRGYRFVGEMERCIEPRECAEDGERRVVLSADHLLDLVVQADSFRRRRDAEDLVERRMEKESVCEKNGYEKNREDVDATWRDRKQLWDVKQPFCHHLSPSHLVVETFGQTYPYTDAKGVDGKKKDDNTLVQEEEGKEDADGENTKTFELHVSEHHRGIIASGSFVPVGEAIDIAVTMLRNGERGGKKAKQFIEDVKGVDVSESGNSLPESRIEATSSVCNKSGDEDEDDANWTVDGTVAISDFSYALVPNETNEGPGIVTTPGRDLKMEDFWKSPSEYSFSKMTAYDHFDECPCDLVKTWKVPPSDSLVRTGIVVPGTHPIEKTDAVLPKREWVYMNRIDRKLYVASLHGHGDASNIEYDRLPEFVCVFKAEDDVTRSPLPSDFRTSKLLDALRGVVLDTRNVSLLRHFREMLDALLVEAASSGTGTTLEKEDEEEEKEADEDADEHVFGDQQRLNTVEFVCTYKNDEVTAYANEVVDRVYDYLVSRKTQNIRRSRIPHDLVSLGVKKTRKAKGFAYGLNLTGGPSTLAIDTTDDMRKPINSTYVGPLRVGTRFQHCHDLRPDPLVSRTVLTQA